MNTIILKLNFKVASYLILRMGQNPQKFLSLKHF